MEEIKIDDIKIGILQKINERKIYPTKKNHLLTLFKGQKYLRGIFFTKHQDLCQDILYPELVYPIINHGPIDEPTIGVEQYTDLGPLVKSFLRDDTMSYNDLLVFKYFINNKEWVKGLDFERKFGISRKKIGPLTLYYSNDFHLGLPKELGHIIWKINDTKHGFEITKEEKQLKLKK